jgi:hypothetical protein
MVNEEIVTSLRNAINKGDSLQSAIQILINSGYDPREVHEASQFVGGVAPNLQASTNEQIMMQQQKAAIISQTKTPQQNLQTTNQRITQKQTQNFPQKPIQPPTTQSLVQVPNESKTLQPTIEKPKKSYVKEIILVFILLILIGFLILTIIFKDTILGWFS